MSELITFPLPDGANYVIPDIGDENWGQNVTDFLVAIPLGVPPRSGMFTLTGDLSFGPTYGLISQYYKSSVANPATAGLIRLAKTDTIDWRNNANSGDNVLAVNGSDVLTYNGVPLISSASTGNLTDVGTDGIVITGGTGAVLGSGTSLAQTKADASHNGYLSSTDWSTFNGKQAALTFGNLTDVGTDGITVSNGTGAVIGTGTSLAQHVADTSHNGYLTSTDWNTFNGKQTAGNYITALTGDITASGPGSSVATLATVNSNVGSFTNANITVNGKGLITAAANGTPGGVTSITGTAHEIIASASTGAITLSTPQAIDTTSNVTFNDITISDHLIWGNLTTGKLETLNGFPFLQSLPNNVASLFIGYGSGSMNAGAYNITNSVAVGTLAMNQATYSGTDSTSCTAVGVGALSSNTTGFENTAIGYASLSNTVGGVSNTAVGCQTLQANTSGDDNTACGHVALIANTTGNFNTSVGYGSLQTADVYSYNTAVGYNAMNDMVDARNTAIGALSLDQATVGDNTALGYGTGTSLTTGAKNIFIGSAADTSLATVSESIAIGYAANIGANNSIALGYNATTTSANTCIIGASATPITVIPTGGIQGQTGGSTSSAGNVGEVIQSVVLSSGSTTSLTNNAYADVTSISLTAGNWLVTFQAVFNPNGATFTANTAIDVLISTTAGNTGPSAYGDSAIEMPIGGSGGNYYYGTVSNYHVTPSSTTTYYAKVGAAGIVSGTPKAFGRITALRIS